jgi:hypothetical protein
MVRLLLHSGEPRRVIGIIAGILVARHLKAADDLFNSRESPRTDGMVAAAVQWAERIIRLGRSPPRCCSFPALADIAFESSFSASFPNNSAITSLVSRSTETRDLSCFLYCSLFVDELLFFLKNLEHHFQLGSGWQKSLGGMDRRGCRAVAALPPGSEKT